jgi:hypothetical protein
MGKIKDLSFLDELDPPGVILTVAKLVPEAREALPDDEYESRMRRYESMVASNLPLPLFGCEQPQIAECEANPKSEMVCWACGLVARRAGNQSQKKVVHSGGRPRSENPTGQAKRQRKYDLRNYERRRERERERAAIVRANRWLSRRSADDGRETETYCRPCFDVWGWPDEFAAILEAVEAVADILAEHARNLPCKSRAAV